MLPARVLQFSWLNKSQPFKLLGAPNRNLLILLGFVNLDDVVFGLNIDC